MKYAIDATHTSHCYSQTGIQRVVRCIYKHLKHNFEPICWDPYLQAWRPIEGKEVLLIEGNDKLLGKKARRSQWTWQQKAKSHLKRITQSTPTGPGTFSGLLVPEIFSIKTSAAYPLLFPYVQGPKIALFHDNIALKLPTLSPKKTVERYPFYLKELLMFDGIAAISETSKNDLLDYWHSNDISNHPPVRAFDLGSNFQPQNYPNAPLSDTVNILCIGTLEGRKNHMRLLEAAQRLWDGGLKFSVNLIGMVNRETGTEAVKKIKRLMNESYPLQWTQGATEEELEKAYRTCHFTIYPSLMEGFGLPVLESLYYGKPCICSSEGALGEVSREGGCLPCNTASVQSIEQALNQLINDKGLHKKLSVEAKRRKIKPWKAYTKELSAWMSSLDPRNQP